jgi:nicotinamide-nucleotide amidase
MTVPRAAILSVGDELLGGRIVNTNAPYLAQRLTEQGFLVAATETVGDEEFAIADAIKSLCARADTVIIVGGLGPTPDDVTREALAGAGGTLLVTDRALKQEVAKRTHGRAPRKNVRMARIPEGARVFPNPVGTAAGLCVEVGGTPVYALPGFPMEMEAIFQESVVPDLERRFSTAAPLPLRVLQVAGLREAEVAEKLGDLLDRSGEPAVGVTARDGVITVTISGGGAGDRADAIRGVLGVHVFGEGGETLAVPVLRRLLDRGLTLAVAESLTGGLLGGRIVDVPGASKGFVGGIVAYTAAMKQELLGVPKTLLDREGFVSAEVALRMARGARKQLGADVGVATTGVAGPAVDEWGTPVGKGFVAVAGPKAGKEGEAVRELHFGGERNAIRRRFVNAALDLVRLHLGA